MNSNPLVGKTVCAVEVAADKKAIRFVTTSGDVVARADGDCCSDTWIEHVELPALGLPAVVTAVEDIDMPQAESETEYESLEVYGCKISTDKGEIILEYRNLSNGYYGGDLVWPGEYFYGGVYGQNISDAPWANPKEDEA